MMATIKEADDSRVDLLLRTNLWARLLICHSPFAEHEKMAGNLAGA